MPPICYATIGTSFITDTWIKSTAATDNLWKLEAIYSRSQGSATAFASKYGNPRTFTDLQEMASDPTIQVVYIASPNNLHFQHAKTMLESGKHVILEKPATSTPAELHELLQLAKEKGVFLIEAFRHVHEKTLKAGIDFLAAKKLGQIYGATFNYATYSSRYDKVLAGEEPNIFSLKHSGGSLVDIGVYPISASLAIFGMPQSWRYDPVIVKTGVDGGGVVLLKYTNFTVTINQSKIYASSAPSEIFGEKGTLRMSGIADVEYVDFVDAQAKKTHRLAQGKADFSLQEEAVEFARIINEKDAVAAGLWENLSRGVIEITASLRKENGIVYAVER